MNGMKNLKTETLFVAITSIFLIIFILDITFGNPQAKAMDSDVTEIVELGIDNNEKILEVENMNSDVSVEIKDEDVTEALAEKEIPIEKESSLIYVSELVNNFGHSVINKESMGDSSDAVTIDKDNFDNYRKFIYLSPNRELIAVTVSSEEKTETYIADLEGNMITDVKPGYAISWLPDSTGVLLFLSGFEENARGRQIYYLNVNGKYYDSKLPIGVANADVSSKDKSIVYTLTKTGTDDSTIYIRDTKGKDKLLLEGDKNIFAWVRFSPNGDKIAFLKSDFAINEEKSEIWVINSDGSGAERISGVNWNYPPVWSSDGAKIIFTKGANLWKYDVNQKALISLTNFGDGFVEQTNYSRDGNEIVFSREINGSRQIWSIDEMGEAEQLTHDEQLKSYPLLVD